MLTAGGEEQQRLERPSDLGTDDRARVRYWLMEIDNAGQVMKSWEQDADRICKKYRDENRGSRTGNRFNILAANINTMRPALYNSTPIPDIRRRNQGAPNPVVRDAAAVMERAVSLSLEDGRFDEAIKSCIMDMLQGGRGVVRVRNVPLMSEGEPVWYSVCAERVSWKDFRHQPEAEWSSVNWCSFRHYMDRDQLVELSPVDGERVRLDYSVAAEDTGGTYGKTQGPTDVFKRAAVWEIWDKRTRRCLFIAPSWKKRPLKIEDDPLRLEAFFPIAPPIWADKDPDSMVPLPDYRLYEDLASELDEITRRIQSLIRVCKWRGIYNSSMGALASLENADDGDLKPVDMIDPAGSLENQVWLMPVERVVQVLQQLYQQRQEILGTIYEITGLSDIIRGNTDPNETLGSQRIKAQWASGKLSTRQGDVQRLCRDIIRMKAEIIVEHWPPEILSAMTGVMVSPEIAQLLTSDQLRMWMIDVETDSTIQADLTDARENIGQLIDGMGSFIQAFAPAVQGGIASGGDAVKLLAAFSKPFRLGRTAEQVFDEMVAKAEQQEQQPQQGPPPDPAMLKIQGDMHIAQQRLEHDKQIDVAKLQLEHMKSGLAAGGQELMQAQAQNDFQLSQSKAGLEFKTAEIEFARTQAKAVADQNMLRIEQQERFARAQAEIIKANAEAEEAKAAAAKAAVEAQIATEVSRQQAEIAMQAERDKAEVASLEAKAAAAKAQAEAQLAVAQAEAEAHLAAELAKQKAEVALQMERDKAQAAKLALEAKLREDMAIVESERRRREIEEKVLIREREAELAIVELRAVDAKAQSDAAAAEVIAKQNAANAAAELAMKTKLMEEVAAGEAARRQREIEEKALIRQKEAELAIVESQASGARFQSQTTAVDMTARQALADAELQKAQLELQMLQERAALVGDQSAVDAEKQAKIDQFMQLQAETMQRLVAVVSAPKVAIRDKDGFIIGLQAMMEETA